MSAVVQVEWPTGNGMKSTFFHRFPFSLFSAGQEEPGAGRTAGETGGQGSHTAVDPVARARDVFGVFGTDLPGGRTGRRRVPSVGTSPVAQDRGRRSGRVRGSCDDDIVDHDVPGWAAADRTAAMGSPRLDTVIFSGRERHAGKERRKEGEREGRTRRGGERARRRRRLRRAGPERSMFERRIGTFPASVLAPMKAQRLTRENPRSGRTRKCLDCRVAADNSPLPFREFIHERERPTIVRCDKKTQ